MSRSPAPITWKATWMPSLVWTYRVCGTGTGPAAGRSGGRPVRRRGLERGILTQDPGVQLPQLGAGLDRQLADQGVAQLPVDTQRVCLPPGAVEREHPLVPESLTERMGHGERLQLRDEVPVPAAGQHRLGPRLQRGEALLLQPPGFHAGRGDRVEVGERGSAPQAQGLIQAPRRRGGIATRQRRVALGGELLEPQRVQFAGRHSQQVTRRPGDQPVGFTGGPERLAQLGQADLQAARRLVGRLAWPQVLEQPVGRNDLVGVHEQHGQHRPAARPRQLQGKAAGRHLERTEHTKFH
jgi:hypothetical protein